MRLADAGERGRGHGPRRWPGRRHTPTARRPTSTRPGRSRCSTGCAPRRTTSPTCCSRGEDPPGQVTTAALLAGARRLVDDLGRACPGSWRMSRPRRGDALRLGPAARARRVGLAAVCVIALNSPHLAAGRTRASQALAEHTATGAAQPVTRAMVRLLDGRGTRPTRAGRGERRPRLQEDSDRGVASLALLWSSLRSARTTGTRSAAIALAERALALWRDDDGPCGPGVAPDPAEPCSARSWAGGRGAARTSRPPAARPARGVDDAAGRAFGARLRRDRPTAGSTTRTRSSTRSAESHGRPRSGAGCRRSPTPSWPSPAATAPGGSLRAYRSAMERLRSLRFPGLDEPSGLEPWACSGRALRRWRMPCTGPARRGRRVRRAPGQEPAALRPGPPAPAGLPRRGTGAVRAGRLGPAARRPSRSRTRCASSPSPTGSATTVAPPPGLGRVAAQAERRAPGRLEQALAENGDRHGPGLLEAARAVAARLG